MDISPHHIKIEDILNCTALNDTQVKWNLLFRIFKDHQLPNFGLFAGPPDVPSPKSLLDDSVESPSVELELSLSTLSRTRRHNISKTDAENEILKKDYFKTASMSFII
jgi:hypothetical protein